MDSYAQRDSHHGLSPDDLLLRISVRVGGLSADEESLIVGAIRAGGIDLPDDGSGFPGDDGFDTRHAERLSALIAAGRSSVCASCGRPLTEHTLALHGIREEVWCRDSTAPALRWRALRPSEAQIDPGPAPVPGQPPVPSAADWLLWVGLPLASGGLLAWVAPALAGAMRRDREWGVLALGMVATAFGALSLLNRGAPARIVLPVLGITLALLGSAHVARWAAERHLPVPTAAAARAAGLDPSALAARQYRSAYALWCVDVLESGRSPLLSSIRLDVGELALWTGPGELIERRPGPPPLLHGRLPLDSWYPGYQPPEPELRSVDVGVIVVTDRRVIFSGALSSREWPLARLRAVLPWPEQGLTMLPTDDGEEAAGVQLVDDAQGTEALGGALDVAVAALSTDLATVRAQVTSV